MDIEKRSQQSLDESKSCILEAQNLMDKMAALRGKLNIKEGAGRRYLQKIKPDEASLKTAEKEIANQYTGKSSNPKQKKKRHKNLMNALHRHGRA
ncbi:MULTISPECIES: hypothetical protein [unclassified Endozoicomonas]|uniref:hypothetical protein n=1 Tax=unclassified Endozoicomonas TaxID=2644528 RepID=UPI002148E6BC|nr:MULTISPECIES: hypothetical protein [unclassified Endozoicomonas]